MNGQLTGTSSGTAASLTSTDTTRKAVIGKPWFSYSYSDIQATLDELRIYERMLSLKEIEVQGKTTITPDLLLIGELLRNKHTNKW